jgi:leader peptidase (prepilin peptidase)/N-methyltransferase
MRLGWDPALIVWAYLVPVGVALAVVDWRTRLLPTKVIAPSYAVVVLLTLVAALVSGDWDSLIRAGWGWLVAGVTFFVLWFVYPRGMGYGDVRLSGLLGIALGYLGWGELLTGIYAGFLIGGVGGLLLSLLRIVDRKAYPFGPFMLVGAVVGVLAGPYVAAWYA